MEIFSFGERLMIYRKRAGLSKKELAKRVGTVSYTHLMAILPFTYLSTSG